MLSVRCPEVHMVSKKVRHLVTWREYERAMFNDLYYRFRPPTWRVEPDLRTLQGLISGVDRQVDVAVFRGNARRPHMAVECRRYARTLNIKDVEGFLGMLGDLGAKKGFLVTPLGFSSAARRRVHGARVVLMQLPEREAQRLNWRELARAAYPWDEGFHPEMGAALDAMLVDDDIKQCVEAMEGLPFEEWESVVRSLANSKPAAASRMLDAIARSHPDDGWRYNAVRLLHELGAITQDLIAELMPVETDPETLELLHDLTWDGAGI
jgi:hypothetical protein